MPVNRYGRRYPGNGKEIRLLLLQKALQGLAGVEVEAFAEPVAGRVGALGRNTEQIGNLFGAQVEPEHGHHPQIVRV